MAVSGNTCCGNTIVVMPLIRRKSRLRYVSSSVSTTRLPSLLSSSFFSAHVRIRLSFALSRASIIVETGFSASVAIFDTVSCSILFKSAYSGQNKSARILVGSSQRGKNSMVGGTCLVKRFFGRGSTDQELDLRHLIQVHSG